MLKQILLSIVVGGVLLGVWVFVSEGVPPEPPEEQWTTPSLVGVDHLEINSADERIVLERNHVGWLVAEPGPYRANPWHLDRIQTFIEDTEHPYSALESRPDTPENRAALGLGGGGVQLTLQRGGETVLDAWLPHASDTSGSWMVPAGEALLVRTNRSLAALVDHELNEFRTLDVLVLTRAQQEGLSRIEAAGNREQLRFERSGEDWYVTVPAGFVFDESLVWEFVNEIDTLRGIGFADGVTPEVAGLVDPGYRLEITTGGTDYSLAFGASTEHEGTPGRYVQRDGGPTFIVADSDAQRFMIARADLVNRGILEIAAESVTRIEIFDETTEGTSEAVLERVTADPPGEGWSGLAAEWQVRSPSAGAVDPQTFLPLLMALTDIDAERVFPAGSGPRLGDLARRFTLTMADGTTHEIEISQSVPESAPESRLAQVDGGLVFQLAGHGARVLLGSTDSLLGQE